MKKKTTRKNKPGAGRPGKFSEKTKLITFRCPESKVEEFREKVEILLEIYKIKPL